MGIFSFLTKEIAIDLGTANTIIIHNDKVVVDEPSIVAIDRITGKIIAVGTRAMMMHGKTHENIKTVRPLKDGVIADFQAAEHMIREMIKMISPKEISFPPITENGCLYPIRKYWKWKNVPVRDSAEQAGRQRSKTDTRTYGCRYWYWYRCT